MFDLLNTKNTSKRVDQALTILKKLELKRMISQNDYASVYDILIKYVLPPVVK